MNWCEYREFVVKNTKPKTKEWLKADVLNAGYDIVRDHAQLKVFLYGSTKVKMLADVQGVEYSVVKPTCLDAELRNDAIAMIAASVARLNHMSKVLWREPDTRSYKPVSNLLVQLEYLETLTDPVENSYDYLCFLSSVIAAFPGVTLDHIIDVSVKLLTNPSTKALF